MPQNKNQHYIPAFYLYNFTSAEQQKASQTKPKRETSIYHYDFKKGRLMERPIRNVATESYLYSYPDKDNSYNHSLDEELQQVENNASTAIKQLSLMVKDSLKTKKTYAIPIADSLIDAIIDLLCWQIKRHPETVKGFETECETFCIAKGYSSKDAKRIALDSIRKLGESGEFDLRAVKGGAKVRRVAGQSKTAALP